MTGATAVSIARLGKRLLFDALRRLHLGIVEIPRADDGGIVRGTKLLDLVNSANFNRATINKRLEVAAT